MSLFNLLFRDNLQSQNQNIVLTAILNELDNLTTKISAWAGNEHNDDGTHNLLPHGYSFVPVGSMVYWPLTTPPTHWLICNGAAISRTRYPILFKTLGITSGVGDGTTTFNIPNVANYIILAA